MTSSDNANSWVASATDGPANGGARPESLQDIFGDAGSVTALAWSPGETQLAIGSVAEKLSVFDFGADKMIWTKQADDSGQVWSLAWSADGGQLASAANDKPIRIWNATNGDELRTFPEPVHQPYQLAWSPDGLLATAAGNRAYIWKSETGKRV